MHRNSLSKLTSNMDHRIILPARFIRHEIYGGLPNQTEVTVPRSLRSKQQTAVGNFLLKTRVPRGKRMQHQIINFLEHRKAAVTLRAHKTAKRVSCSTSMESKKSFLMIRFVMWIGKELHTNNTKIAIICQPKQQQVEGKRVLGNHRDQVGIEI